LNNLTIRAAAREDCGVILSFISQLAEYERLEHEMVATRQGLQDTLFGPHPAAEVLIAEQDGDPAGFALFFGNYSTFLAQPGIYLEDLFVRPEYRGRGIGKALLNAVAGIALERDCGRLDWSVLDWNEPAIVFYRGIGARPLEDWTQFRLDGAALAGFANQPAADGV
jgi:GNAT superfamily N-acetyltransferase